MPSAALAWTGSANIPQTAGAIAPTTKTQIDYAIARLRERRHAWLDVSLAQRIDILNALLVSLRKAAPGWVTDSLRAKNISSNDPSAAEEWLPVYAVARNLR